MATRPGVAGGRLAWTLCCGMLATSPAWAMRAHVYIDADQRAMVTLAQDRAAPQFALAPQPPAADELLAPRPQAAPPPAGAQPAVSPVPEPSGYMMLGLGLILLLLRSRGSEANAIAPDPDKPFRL